MATKKSALSVPQKLALKGKSGAKVEIDVSEIKASKAQKEVLGKLLASGSLESLTVEERNKIKNLKAAVGLGTPAYPALIVRFDVTWVRIDEK